MPFSKLPLDIKTHIATFLPGDALVNAGVNKEFNAIVNKEKIWKELAKKCHISGLDPFEPAKPQVIGRIKDLNCAALMDMPTQDSEPIDVIGNPFEKFEAIKKYFFTTKKADMDLNFAAILQVEGPVDLVSLFLANGAKTKLNDSREPKVFKALVNHHQLHLDNQLKTSVTSDNDEWENLDALLTAGARPESETVKFLIDKVVKEFYRRRRDNSIRPEFLHALMLQMLCKYLTEDQKKELTAYTVDKRQGMPCDFVKYLISGKTLFSKLNLNEANREQELKIQMDAKKYHTYNNSLEDDVIRILSDISDYEQLAIILKYCTAEDKIKLLQALDFAEREAISKPEISFARKREFIKNDSLQKPFREQF